MENVKIKIKKLMVEKNLNLSVAESLTSGNLQTYIGSISGASDFFEGGITTYSINQKIKILGVNKNHAIETNCVSAMIAQQMAEGVCKIFNTQIGISTTGYAEPYKHNKILKNPFAYYCIWNNDSKEIIKSAKIILNFGNRVSNQTGLVKIIIEDLFTFLLNK